MTELVEGVAKYFPYATIRPFQGEFAKTVYEAVKNCQSVLIEGSNGLGKTIAALSACLPEALDKDLKILYVSRTHHQHERVIEELRAISKRQPVSGVSMRGRHEMCLNNFVIRHAIDAKSAMEACELLKAKDRCRHYRNVEENAGEFSQVRRLIVSSPCKASEIQRICREKGFCPYELLKTLLPDVNVIALSYLYVFDSSIRAAFLKNLETPLHKILLIVDEAHNLPETVTEISSSSLSLFVIKQAELEAKKFKHKDCVHLAKLVRNEIEKMVEKIDEEALVSPEFLIELFRRKAGMGEPGELFEYLHEIGSSIKRRLLAEGKYPRSYIHGMSEFLLKWLETAEDESFVNVVTKYPTRKGAKTARLEIIALDPSKVTAPVFSSVYSSIIMSGTLQPLEGYARISKLPENTVKNVMPSPFPKDHVLSLVSLGVTTAMEKRTSAMYMMIIKRINEVVQNTPANTGIFAASFDVLEALISEGLEKTLEKPLFREHRGMSSKENERIVSQFKACAERGGAVLLGVQGGRSSEGVDYPGDQMNSVVIVGVPYAEPSPRVKAQISYFEKCFPSFGREYSYVLPAMRKASQAAGRPIRTLEDKGAIVFLDHRFATFYCQRFLPSWIRRNLKTLPNSDNAIAHEISHFYKLPMVS